MSAMEAELSAARACGSLISTPASGSRNSADAVAVIENMPDLSDYYPPMPSLDADSPYDPNRGSYSLAQSGSDVQRGYGQVQTGAMGAASYESLDL